MIKDYTFYKFLRLKLENLIKRRIPALLHLRETWHKKGGKLNGWIKSALDQPHILIGGATGSGKSVMLDQIIYTLAVTQIPPQCNIYICDVKRVGFNHWRRLPHVKAIAKTRQDVIAVLRFSAAEMERRYARMERRGLSTFTGTGLYIIIDELADLTLTSDRAERKEIMELLQHIAELGRAAGVHLIAATQAPSRKSIPAEIALNMTARIALRCDSAIESRQIIGQAGAEQLPRYGDAMVKTPGELHWWTGLEMLTDAEIEETVKYYRRQL